MRMAQVIVECSPYAFGLFMSSLLFVFIPTRSKWSWRDLDKQDAKNRRRP